ncbi:EF-hand domain-containing protein 1 [Gouania willdenowi]|uniref:DM10 domain-containing protein n=1 Tax=Gouania willdenowi TaxID=441366 RepID=A0A8C5ETG2_GOUWI|nr:EF-hand domain-containing protein 1 [Gouania willdenowi]
MSWHESNHGLPLLPGYTFRDQTKSAFHRPQTLGYRNGVAFPRRPTIGIGHDRLISDQLTQDSIDELPLDVHQLTYPTVDHRVHERFTPAYVALDKKVLRFFAYFSEKILYSLEEEYRVRPVIIYYYLENDTMSITEPKTENSGIPQGKRVKRQHFPKSTSGRNYLWKDLNVGMDLVVFGVLYRITGCDEFTEDFLIRGGIVLNEPEQIPLDPYNEQRQKPPITYHNAPPKSEQVKKFLTMDPKVLRFFAQWDESCETRLVSILYYLIDDTVEIREAPKPNSGRDPVSVLLQKTRIPKKMKAETFPSCVMEFSHEEVEEYFSPKDFSLGQSVSLLGHQFLLYDCDAFTKDYYQKNYPEIEMNPIELPANVIEKPKPEIPPYNGYGSLEDSLQNCLRLVPQPPKKNVLKMQENAQKVLRYIARLESQDPVDDVRRFVISYSLSDDMMTIFEKPAHNSGIIAGKFLEKTRVPKPGSTVDHPEFYSPADFAIGARVEVFGHRFVLTDADSYVLSYLESIAGQIPSQTLDSLRMKLCVQTANIQPDDVNDEAQSNVN